MEEEDKISKETGKVITKIAKGISFSFFGLGLKRILMLAAVVILGRYLGPEKFGLFNIAYAVIMIGFTFSLFGLDIGVASFIPRYKEENRLKEIISSSVFIVFCVSVLTSGVIYIFSPQISIVIFHNPGLASIIRFFVPLILFLAFSSLFLSALLGFKEIKKIVIANLIGEIGLVGILFFLLHLGFALKGAIISYFIGYTIITLIAFIFLKKTQRSIFSSVKIQLGRLSQKLIRFSFPVLGTNMLRIVKQKSYIFLLGYFLSAFSIGLYHATFSIGHLFTIVSTVLNRVSLPYFSSLYSEGKKQTLQDVYRIIIKWFIMLLLPVFLIMYFLPGEILNLVFGKVYQTSDTIISLKILAIGFFMSGLIGPWHLIIYAMDRTKTEFKLTSAATLTLFGIGVVAIPKIGIVGAAIATTTSLILIVFLAWRVIRKTNLMPFCFKQLKVFIIGMIWFTVFYFIYKNFLTNVSVILTSLSLITYYLTHLIIIAFLKSGPEDKLLFNLFKKEFRRLF